MLIVAIVYVAISVALGIAAFMGGREEGETLIQSFFISLSLALFWPFLIGLTVLGLVWWGIVGD